MIQPQNNPAIKAKRAKRIEAKRQHKTRGKRHIPIRQQQQRPVEDDWGAVEDALMEHNGGRS